MYLHHLCENHTHWRVVGRVAVKSSKIPEDHRKDITGKPRYNLGLQISMDYPKMEDSISIGFRLVAADALIGSRQNDQKKNKVIEKAG